MTDFPTYTQHLVYKLACVRNISPAFKRGNVWESESQSKICFIFKSLKFNCLELNRS